MPMTPTPVASALILAAADASTVPFDPITLIGTLFTPAVVIYLILAGKLRTGRECERLEAENDALRSALTATNAAMVEKVVPALTLATAAIGRKATEDRRG